MLLDVGDAGWVGVEGSCGLALGNVFGFAKALQVLGLPGSWLSVGECAVCLAGYGSFEAAYGVSFASAFSGSAVDVRTCPFVVSHPDECNAVQCTVAAPVTTAVEAVAVGAA